MLNRPVILVSGGAAVVLCVSLIWRCQPELPEPKLELSDSAGESGLMADALTRSQLRDALWGRLRMFDSVSGAELERVATITPEVTEQLTVASGDMVDLSEFAEAATISLDESSNGDPLVVSLGDSTNWTGDEWHATLPYNSGLFVTITGAPGGIELPRSDFYLLPHPSTLSEEQLDEVGIGPFALPVSGMTLTGKAKWLFRKGVLKPVHHEAAGQSPSLKFFKPLSGDFVVLWVDNVGNQAFGEVTLVRGERSELFLPYLPRPILVGTLMDWNGDPVPNGRIKVIVSLDLLNYDFLPMDPHALGAIRTDAEGWFHTIQLSYTTDASGHFSCTTPKGSEYAIQSFALGSYAFWSSLDSGLYPAEGMKLELQLMKPDQAQTRLIIMAPTEHALTGAEVIGGLVSDLPFMRSWPRLTIDDEGAVTYAGLEPGRLATFFVKHPSLKSGVHAERIVIPDVREIRLSIPATAFRLQ